MLLTGIAPFGAWMYCDKCKTSCEALKLYGLAYKTANPADIISQLRTDLKLKTLSPSDIALYCNFYDTYYNKVQLIWDKARKNLSPIAHSAAIGRLNELNLWTNQEIFNKSLVNWFGYLPKYELEELLQDSVPGLPKSADGALLMPFLMKPGFVCGFGVIGPKDNMTYINMMNEKACGFCGLDDATLTNNPETYVMQHPLQAARIRHKCSLERYDKLSTVAKGFIGELDCTALNGDVVVWVDDPEDSFFKTCIVSRGFKVISAETPYIWKPTEKTSKMWQYNLMPTIHNQILSLKLQDPVDYFVSEILIRNPGRTKLTLEGMGLSEFQKNMILSSCDDTVRGEVESILKHAVQSQPIMIDKKTVFEKDGKLWIRGSREVADEMVCDFLMRINHICRNKNDGSATVFGKIILPNGEIQFQADEDDMESNPKNVVATLLASTGNPLQPYIAESIRKKYLDIILRFSSPEVHSVQGFVGYDSDTGKFSLPTMCIGLEQIKVGMPFVMTKGPMPCSEVVMAPGDTVNNIKHLFSFSIETAAYIGAMSCVLSNIYNNIEQNTRTSTILVGGRGSLAEYTFDLIRIDMGLILVNLNSKSDMELAKELATLHHVPVAIDGSRSNPRILSQWLEGQGGNSLVVTHSLNAAAMSKDKDWYFVRADIPILGESQNLLRSEQVFPFFTQYMLTIRPSSAHTFLDSLNHLAKSLGIDDQTTTCAKAMVSEYGLINAQSPAVHLINLIHEGVEAGMFKTFTGEGTKKDKVVLKNPMKDTVTVNITNLLGQIRFFDLPSSNWDASIRQLKELGVREVDLDGKIALEFDKPIWNSVVGAIKRMKALRKAFLNKLLNVVL